MAASKSSNASLDAIELLMADHREVEKLFKKFEKNKENDQALEDIVSTACSELKVHSQIEKEIFYPAVMDKAGKELKEQLDEAEVEHEAVDNLVLKLLEVKLGDDMYKANFIVLMEFVKHHVKEEEEEMFPLVRKLKGLDLDALGMQMQERKEELMAELTGEEAMMSFSAAARGKNSKGHRPSA